MKIVQIRLGPKAQVVIPKKARLAIGLAQGKPATLVVDDGIGILLGDPKTYGTLLRGLGKEIWVKAGGRYLKKERNAWEKET